MPDNVAKGSKDGFNVDAFLRNLPSFAAPGGAGPSTVNAEQGSGQPSALRLGACWSMLEHALQPSYSLISTPRPAHTRAPACF